MFQGSFAVRPLSSAAAGASAKAEEGKGGGGKDAKGALAVEQEEYDAITDQIPQRPMGVVEGTSYTLLIAAGIAIAGGCALPRRRSACPCIRWHLHISLTCAQPVFALHANHGGSTPG